MAALKKFGKKKGEAEHHDDHVRHDEHKDHGGGHDEGNWLVSYADMMTLLCGFFIMMFSMAKMDEPQFEKVKRAVSKQFGGEYKSPNDDLTRFITQIAEENGMNGKAVVRSDPWGVSIVFLSTVFFDTLSADIRPEGAKMLNTLMGAIRSKQETEQRDFKIVIEGHTDGRPVVGGSFPSNWELSGSRASRVVRLFIESGFKPNMMTAIGYGSTHPEYPERKPDGTWDQTALEKNRRVVVRILQPKADTIPFPGTGEGDETAETHGELQPEAHTPAEGQTAAPAAEGQGQGQPVAGAEAPKPVNPVAPVPAAPSANSAH